MVSVSAYTGVRSPKYRTLKLPDYLGGLKLVTLVDTGSTNNFIDECVAAHLGMSTLAGTSRNIRVGNDDVIQSGGVIPGVPVVVGNLAANERFDIDFHPLPLGGYDVVLGVEWLGTLGPVLFDFGRQTMAIARPDHRVLWTSLDGPATPTVYTLEDSMADLLRLLLDEYAAVFRNRTACLRSAGTATASDWRRGLRPLRCAHTVTRTCRKTSWNGNALRCYATKSSAPAPQRSPRQLYWCASPTVPGACALTTEL